MSAAKSSSFEFLDSRFATLDSDDTYALTVEGARDQQAGLAATTEDVERLAELFDATYETRRQQNLLEALVPGPATTG
jgi:hypothetical protein